MKNSMEEFTSDYEETLNKLSNQITELFSEINYYQALITEKDNKIIQLTTENSKLKTQIQNMSQSLNPPSYPSQPVKPIITSAQQAASTITPQVDIRVNKRRCPECGADGFAIKEVDDKTRIISYTPRRIYAKKKACTKCRYEWF
jgi:chromosome segregation ATPase